MRAACRDANIDPAIPFHGLRHTWASLAVMGGMPMMVVERYYGHLREDFIDKAVREHAPRYGLEPPSGAKSVLCP